MKIAFNTCLAFQIIAGSLLFSNEEEQKPYLTATILGGLGNRMFQVATACAVGWEHGAEAYFPELLSKPTLYHHLFSKCKIFPPTDEVSVYVREGFPITFEPKMRLGGYFQEERYFAAYRDQLLDLFAPSARDMKYIHKKYGSIVNQSNTVGVQIRYYRREVVDGFPQYGRRYLEKAMALFSEDSLFVVSSDHLEFAREQMPSWVKNVVFLDKEPDYIDFFIMSLCKDNIITNSSFGWWSAWLNRNPEKKVVCPDHWTSLSSEWIFPHDWVRLAAEPEDL